MAITDLMVSGIWLSSVDLRIQQSRGQLLLVQVAESISSLTFCAWTKLLGT